MLLKLLDQREAVVSAAALQHFGNVGEALLRAGFLVAAGHEPATISGDHDDAPVQLAWSPEHEGYGYFSATAGWVSVGASAIGTYRVNVEVAVRTLFGGLLSPKATIRPLEGYLAFDLGNVRIPGRKHRVPTLFAPCVSLPEPWRTIRDLLLARPAPRLRLVLTATGRDRLPADAPLGNVVVSIEDLLGSDQAFLVDAEILGARLRLHSTQGQSDGPLSIDADGRVVRLHGKEFRFPRGEKQRDVIRYLYRCYSERRFEVDVEEVKEHCDLPEHARIRDSFKGSNDGRVMTELLFESGGVCGFRIGAREEG